MDGQVIAAIEMVVVKVTAVEMVVVNAAAVRVATVHVAAMNVDVHGHGFAESLPPQLYRRIVVVHILNACTRRNGSRWNGIVVLVVMSSFLGLGLDGRRRGAVRLHVALALEKC